MAKLDEVYPNIRCCGQIAGEGQPAYTFIRVSAKLPCEICKEETSWINLVTGLHICSEECNEKLKDKFITLKGLWEHGKL